MSSLILPGGKVATSNVTPYSSGKKEPTGPVKGGNQRQENPVDPVVMDIIRATKARQIPMDRAASIITGRIRILFVKAIRSDKSNDISYEASSFRYLDEILFNGVCDIICSVMQYSSRGTIGLKNVMSMIIDTANLIEYYIPEEDFNTIRGILREVYNEF